MKVSSSALSEKDFLPKWDVCVTSIRVFATIFKTEVNLGHPVLNAIPQASVY